MPIVVKAQPYPKLCEVNRIASNGARDIFISLRTVISKVRRAPQERTRQQLHGSVAQQLRHEYWQDVLMKEKLMSWQKWTMSTFGQLLPCWIGIKPGAMI